MAAQQPPWAPPIPKAQTPVLKVYNSLTKSKVRIVAGSQMDGHHMISSSRQSSFHETVSA